MDGDDNLLPCKNGLRKAFRAKRRGPVGWGSGVGVDRRPSSSRMLAVPPETREKMFKLMNDFIIKTL
ncbi:hypothetical protein D3870_02455 [Noviherbaspirillum cavernae]|uniref:Uncharacterized protein n=1 Tax=Noviherbaspirillum cavernae TaxID=2320862 RepID=A0A418WXV1_9BURK|nr:hypothetical protein D3870_02455 [Noviherbaspirillum cavernae]